MSVKINSKYLENYAIEFSKIVCDQYFSTKKYMTGTEILGLTPSKQVNFFVIKSLFEAWHVELEKLKSNPYFDYRDNNVYRALNEFMNVLSRSIKIDRENFEPLIGEAVAFSILVALEPLSFFKNEFEKSTGSVNDFLKENKKYYKWHTSLIENLIDRAGISQSKDAYLAALIQNYDQQKDKLQSAEELLSELKGILHLDFDILVELAPEPETVPEEQSNIVGEQEIQIKEEVSIKEEEILIAGEGEDDPKVYKVSDLSKAIDPLQAWAKFESEQYSVMKGTVAELSESIGINQRFMFTKELFDGNPDLMRYALKSIDQCTSFTEAVSFLNERFVEELNWDKDAESVEEFLLLIFRKFDQKG